jgi:hypothetical protein
MNNLNRIGGLSALLFGLLKIVGIALSTIPFASAPPEVFELTQVEARLAFVASWPQAQRLSFAVGSNLEVLAILFLVPPLMALYAMLKGEHSTNALLAAGLGLVSIPILTLFSVQRFPFLDLGELYGLADSAGKAGLAAIHILAENYTLMMERIFLMFFGPALFLYSRALIRAAFSRPLAVFGAATGIAAIVGAIGPAILIQLEFLPGISSLLLIVWHIWLGIVLFKK